MLTSQHHPLDADVVARFTGQRSVRDPARAASILDGALEALNSAEREDQEQRNEVHRRRAELNSAETAFRRCRLSRAILDRGWSPGLAAMVGSGMAAVVLALILISVAPPSAWMLLVYVLGIGLCGLYLFIFLGDVEDLETATARVDSARQNWLHAVSLAEQTSAVVQERMKAGYEARRLYEGLRRAVESSFLLESPIDQMEGTEFEQYLARLFAALGCQVEHTGQSGDQGVDLIVRDTSMSIAVQAKCWQGSVGNSAVQEAYAGKTYYGCDACAVVTNSCFTEPARKLANKLGCQLIEGKDIPLLIKGHVRLGPGAGDRSNP